MSSNARLTTTLRHFNGVPMKLVQSDTSGRLPTSTFDLVRDGEMVGFAQVRHRPSCNADLPPEAGNHLYYKIAETHRGRGYGKALMTLALAEAKRIGLKNVRLTCLADDLVSKHIIQSNGAIWLRDFHSKKGEWYHLFEVTL
jgi:predicted acetyltransferase